MTFYVKSYLGGGATPEILPFKAALMLFITSIFGFFLTGSSGICASGFWTTGGGPIPKNLKNVCFGIQVGQQQTDFKIEGRIYEKCHW